MKFRLPKDTTKKTIAYILSVVNDSVVLVASNAANKKVAFEGASSGAYVRVNLKSDDVESDGVIAVDGSQLASIKFPTDVVFAADGSNLNFASGTLRGSVKTLDSGAHVRTQRPQGKLDDMKWVQIPRDLMTKAMSSTVFDASLKSSIDGVTMRIENGQLIMHAFDAVRASLYVAPIDSAETVRAVLAGNFFAALKKIPGDKLEMSFDAGNVLVRTDSATIVYATLQTETQDVLADVTELLQQPYTGTFVIAAKRMTDALTTAASVVRGGLDYDTRVDLDITKTDEGSKLRLTLVSDHGQIQDTITLDGDVEPCAFGISGKHMAEMLALLSGDVHVRFYGGMVLFVGDEGRATIAIATLA